MNTRDAWPFYKSSSAKGAYSAYGAFSAHFLEKCRHRGDRSPVKSASGYLSVVRRGFWLKAKGEFFPGSLHTAKASSPSSAIKLPRRSVPSTAVKATGADMIALPACAILLTAFVATLPAALRALRTDPTGILRTE
jgi:hypothetical protein